MTRGTLLILFVSTLQSAPAAERCVGAPSAPRLDHVILVVGDLDRASEGFRAHGFRLKPGRLHPNNLLNPHQVPACLVPDRHGRARRHAVAFTTLLEKRGY